MNEFKKLVLLKSDNPFQVIKDCASLLGFHFEDWDCDDIIKTAQNNETVYEAVHDYLCAYEL